MDGIWKKQKKSYDSTKKFQVEWASKLPWVKGILVEGGFIHTMRCKVYTLIENKNKIVGCMWDILTKHVGCRITIWDLPRFKMKKGGTYIAKDCGHLKNMILYAQRGPQSVLTQVNKLMGEGNWKLVQMKVLFHVFTHGCPMLNMKPCMNCLLT